MQQVGARNLERGGREQEHGDVICDFVGHGKRSTGGRGALSSASFPASPQNLRRTYPSGGGYRERIAQPCGKVSFNAAKPPQSAEVLRRSPPHKQRNHADIARRVATLCGRNRGFDLARLNHEADEPKEDGEEWVEIRLRIPQEWREWFTESSHIHRCSFSDEIRYVLGHWKNKMEKEGG